MKTALCFVLACLLIAGCGKSDSDTITVQQAAAPPPANVVQRDGIGVAIIVDCSGSMSESVKDSGSGKSPKDVIARRAVTQLYQRSEDFAKKNPDRNLQVSLYRFDDDVQQVIAFAAPDAAGAAPAISSLKPSGGTGIGNAILKAKADLDATGLSGKHIVVVTDGQNTSGPSPEDVANEMAKNPAKPQVYMVAFDVDSAIFTPVKSAGWMVYSAANADELQQALDVIFGNNILLEK